MRGTCLRFFLRHDKQGHGHLVDSDAIVQYSVRRFALNLVVDSSFSEG